jgi:hypothetical protein
MSNIRLSKDFVTVTKQFEFRNKFVSAFLTRSDIRHLSLRPGMSILYFRERGHSNKLFDCHGPLTSILYFPRTRLFVQSIIFLLDININSSSFHSFIYLCSCTWCTPLSVTISLSYWLVRTLHNTFLVCTWHTTKDFFFRKSFVIWLNSSEIWNLQHWKVLFGRYNALRLITNTQ